LPFIKNQRSISSTTLNRAYEIYVQEMINLSMGQAMDIAWHKGLADANSLNEENYLQMCAYKTGALARIAARLAAVLCEADDETIERFGNFAEAIGVAFQIQDDVLDITGEKFAEKKGARGMDITEGKRTLMVIHALREATIQDRKRLLEILDTTRETAGSQHLRREEAISILKKYGAIDYAREWSRKIVKDGWNGIADLLPTSDAKKQLKEFADYLIEREI
jgi:geranylgeranyl pyrophosphate synthase